MSTEIPLRSNLRECGSDRVSDWAILNDTNSSQLRRILATVHSCTNTEIEQACHLLESYHAVYRQNLMRLRSQGCRGKCPLPTTAQLQQIAQHLQQKTYQSYSPQQVMHKLQAIAQKLRQRISSKVHQDESLKLSRIYGDKQDGYRLNAGHFCPPSPKKRERGLRGVSVSSREALA